MIYILDLGGNVRKNPKLSGTVHNVFGIQVGVSINLFVKKKAKTDSQTAIFYARVDEYWRKEDKFHFLDTEEHYANLEWKLIEPDIRHLWLTEGQHAEFETYVPMGTREVKDGKNEAVDVVFQKYSLGVSTNRDVWVRNFSHESLTKNIQRLIDTYNDEVIKWERRPDRSVIVDDFVAYEDSKISWSSTLKNQLKQNRLAEYAELKVRHSLYRPFTNSRLFFDRVMNDRVAVFPSIFPTQDSERENRAICVTAVGNTKPFHCLMTKQIADLHLTGDSQCFPLLHV